MERISIRDTAQFEKLADRFVTKIIQLQQAKAYKAKQIKDAQECYDRQARRLEDAVKKLSVAFEKYLRGNGDIMGGKKSIQVGRLYMGFRIGNPILLDKDTEDDLAPEEITRRIQNLAEDTGGRTRKELRETLKTEVKPVMNVIKELPGRLLDSLGLTVHQKEDFFWKIIE